MDSLRSLTESIQIKDRLSLLALVVVIVIALADVLFAWKFILPAWQDRRELASQLASAEKALEDALKAQEASPEKLQKEIATAEAALNDAAGAFLSDSQASEVLNKLYQYAGQSQVEIASLQTQPAPPDEEKKESYDVKEFRLQAVGPLPNLVDFVSQIKEAAFESFVIDNVNIAQGGEGAEQEQHTLGMDITLYTSSLSSGAVVQPTPGVTATPASLAELEEALGTAWESGDWERAIGFIEQILALEPDYEGMTEKLYAARVNYGYQLLGKGDPDGATAQFNSALEIKPDGPEAQAGREQAAAWVPTPTTAPTPSTPAPTLTAEEQLAKSLHEPWAVKNWGAVIGIIEQILALNPDYDDMTEKLYAAHVNYGRQLVAEDRLEEAKVEFTRALDVKPDGGEARAELQALAAGEAPVPPTTPTPQPQYTIHVVQRGENLYRISLRYGTTVEAIMAANGLTNYNIYVGQELRIPTQ